MKNNLRHPSAPTILVFIGIVAYAIFFSWFTIARAHNFNAGWYDLGIMSQVVWRVGHGHGFAFTNPEAGPGGLHGWDSPRTAIHADYLLIFLAPLSWTGYTAEGLLIVQALVVACGAWFIYRIADRLLGNRWYGALLAWLYLLYPPLHLANLFEFHSVKLGITFMLAGADAIIRGKHRAWWIWAGLALITKEQVGITVGLMGAALYWWRQERRRALWALLIPWAWVALQLFVIIPYSRPDAAWNFVAGKFYESTGGGAGGLIKRLLDPRVWIERLPTRTHLNDLAQLLGPLGLLPLMSIWPLVVAPEMMLYWLSDSPDQQHIVQHYHTLTVPTLFLGTIFAWRTLRRIKEWGWLRRIARGRVDVVVILALIIGSFLATRAASIWPWSPLTRWPLVAWKERLQPQFKAALDTIPKAAPVAITQNVGPYLAQRPTVHILPNGLYEAEYYVILERKFDPNVKTNSKRYAERTMLEQLKSWAAEQPEVFETTYDYDRVLVIHRRQLPTRPIPEWPDSLLGQ